MSRDLESQLAAVTAERDALRDAVISIHRLEWRRRQDVLASYAIRDTANDLSAPFSDERVRERLVRYLAEEPRHPSPLEIRRREDGTIDEIVVGGAFVHLEMLDRDLVWIGITDRDGKTLHVDIAAVIPPRGKRPVVAVQVREDEPAGGGR